MSESEASEDRPEELGERSGDIGPALEALLLMATEPVTETDLAQTLDEPLPRVAAQLRALAMFYDETGRGLELRNVGGGWRYYTRPELHDVLARSVLEGQTGRLSQAALETLAVAAYLQPITRGRLSAVRGVNVDGVVRTLLARDLLAEAGRDEETGATLFVTTPYFLERMGLASLDDLPPLAPYLPDASELEAELAEAARPGMPADRAEATDEPPAREDEPMGSGVDE